METPDVHLFVLIHGLWGRAQHLDEAKQALLKAWSESLGSRADEIMVNGDANITTVDSGDESEKTEVNGDASPTFSEASLLSSTATAIANERQELVVMVAEGMTSTLTYDGVDVCASRVAWEVDRAVEKLEAEGRRVTHFSVLGYSLGGVVARYLVGLLNARSPSFFEKHEPVSFTTMATPNLGIPRYNTLLSAGLHWLGSRLMSRTGEQLHAADTYSEHDPRPLLEIMADPKHVFHQGLSRFRSIHLYANIVNDTTVPFPSASVTLTDPFVQWNERGLVAEADEAGIVVDWRFTRQPKHKKWMPTHRLGNLPPILRFRWPINYLILALFPILFPLIFLMIVLRFSLDTQRSRRRLQKLARAELPPVPSPADIPKAGLSITALRNAIRAVERGLEQDLMEAAEYDLEMEQELCEDPECKVEFTAQQAGTSAKGLTNGAANAALEAAAAAAPVAPQTIRCNLSPQQQRMAKWLSALDPQRHLCYFPDVANSHAVIVARDPAHFPIHERGRGVLRHWALTVTEEACRACKMEGKVVGVGGVNGVSKAIEPMNAINGVIPAPGARIERRNSVKRSSYRRKSFSMANNAGSISVEMEEMEMSHEVKVESVSHEVHMESVEMQSMEIVA